MKQKPYLIAEIGGNHQGNPDRLRNLTNLAIQSGADCIKFQLYSGDTLVNKKIDKDRNSHFKKFELDTALYKEMFTLVLRAGRDCTASFWSYEFYKEFEKDVPFIKVGSGDLTNYPLLAQFATSNKPIILSTGLSTSEEINKAVNFIRDENDFYRAKANLTLLQCTSMYPIPYSEANLSVMNTFKKLDTLVGYSDHTVGVEALYIAAVLGADVLEFHFTDDKSDTSFRDHLVSLEKADVLHLKSRIRDAFELIGSSVKQPTKSEIDSGHVSSFRRGIYCLEPIQKGEIITMDKLTFLRPDLGGNSASQYMKVLNNIAADNYGKLDPVNVYE